MVRKIDFSNKKIAILGLSKEGSDSAKYFVSKHGIVYCCDRKKKSELGEKYEELRKLGVTFRLGTYYLKNLEEFDLLIRTPGMDLNLPELDSARKNKINISSSIKIFFDLCPAKIIGVTGTKGKGTTSSLISEMVKTTGKKVFLGGNIGTPLLSKLSRITEDDIVILELSSFQLQDLTQSPEIAVVLGISQDHLANFDPYATNYHRNLEEYINAKKSIVCYQTKKDIAVLNLDDPVSRTFAKSTKANIFYFSNKSNLAHAYVENDSVWLTHEGRKNKICTSSEIHLRGRHNLENIAAASIVAAILGVNTDNIKKVAANFIPLEHRLEFVKKIKGVLFYNDSFSTIPEATIAAIKSFNQPIILIAGGSEKGSNYSELGQQIVHSNVKKLLLIGTTADSIETAVKKAIEFSKKDLKILLIRGSRNMEEIVNLAVKQAEPNDVVLLSPGCASFDMFKNYKDRGNQFKNFVNQHVEKKISK